MEQNYGYTEDDIRWIMLSERSQTQKATYCMIPFIGHFYRGKTIENKSVVDGGGGKTVQQCGGLCNWSLSCCGGYKTTHLPKPRTAY